MAALISRHQDGAYLAECMKIIGYGKETSQTKIEESICEEDRLYGQGGCYEG